MHPWLGKSVRGQSSDSQDMCHCDRRHRWYTCPSMFHMGSCGVRGHVHYGNGFCVWLSCVDFVKRPLRRTVCVWQEDDHRKTSADTILVCVFPSIVWALVACFGMCNTGLGFTGAAVAGTCVQIFLGLTCIFGNRVIMKN